MKNSGKKFAGAIAGSLICVLLNIVGWHVATILKLPMYLDLIGSCVATYFFGPIWGSLAGITYNIISGLNSWKNIPFLVVAIVFSFAFKFFIDSGMLKKLHTAIIAGFWIGCITMMISLPVCVFTYGGVTGNIWGDAVYNMLTFRGIPSIVASAAALTAIEVVDKQFTVGIAFFIIKTIRYFLYKNKIKSAKRKIQKEVTLFLAVSLVFMMGNFDNTIAKEYSNYNYSGEIYNSQNGMMSSEANSIAETSDGIIWIGSYAGLTSYDGTSFELIRKGGLANVNTLYTDSKNRLWVGTNDGGVFRLSDGKIDTFSMMDGLSSDIIRNFTEGDDGTIYICTAGYLCSIDKEDKIKIYNSPELTNIFDTYNVIYHEGRIYTCVDGTICSFNASGSDSNLLVCRSKVTEYRRIELTDSGIIAGGADGAIYKINVEPDNISERKLADTNIVDINDIIESSNGYLWVCGQNSFGYIDKGRNYIEVPYSGFDSKFECIHEDYQGNIWIASSRYGVLKIYHNQFGDVYKKYGILPASINAITKYNDELYFGSDRGLDIVNEENRIIKSNELTEMLEGIRIRSMMVDSKNRLWIATYSDNGLICWDGAKVIYKINTESGAPNNKFRCLLELKDKTIVAGTSGGALFINNGRIEKIFSDELENDHILSILQDKNDDVLIGTDGAGLYRIHQGEISERYTKADGLSSGIVLRMTPYKDGIFLVTSNGLCYMEESSIFTLKNFPYYNNFDFIVKDDQAYITSSAGLYVVNADDVLKDEKYGYKLYDVKHGMKYSLNPNSYNYVDGNIMFFCTNNGPIRFDEDSLGTNKSLKYGLSEVVCDNEIITPEDNIYRIPKNAKEIKIKGSVRNYCSNSVFFKIHVDDGNNKYNLITDSAEDVITLRNMEAGTYKVIFEIYGNDGKNIVQSKIYFIEKEAHLWEKKIFKIYIFVIVIDIMVCIAYSIFIWIRNFFDRRKNDKIREENQEHLEMLVYEKTMEIERSKNDIEMLFGQTILALSSTVDAKDRYTSGHSKRVAEYALAIASKMGKDDEEQLEIYYAGLLHDVGKIRIPDGIINKPGKLTREEYNYIKLHPIAGYNILKDISKNSSFAEAARYHHERYDGNGYPNGLKGKDIPEVARIIGVADAYDAMASNRSYRVTLSQEAIKNEIIRCSGTQFDPDIAKIMVELIEEDTDYNMRQFVYRERNVLIVDDEELYIKLAESCLADDDRYKVHSAMTGEDAINMIRNNKYDLVLLDINLPGMDGFETLEHIRNYYSGHVVFMTADREVESIRKARKMGVNDYITKPILAIELKEIVHSILDL